MTTTRALLLGLCAGLSAAACQVYMEGSAGTKDPHAASAAKPPAQPPPQPPPPPSPSAAAPASPAAPSAPAPAPVPAKTLQMHLGGSSAAPGTPTPAPGPAPAAACLDQGAATAGDCTAIKAPIGSCPAFTALQQKCAAYKNNFDPKVGAAAVSCLSGLNATQLCDATQPLACARAALAQACGDPSVAQLCQIAATPCKSTAADCTTLLSGLNSQGQQAVAQCVAQGCGSGLAGCVDGLK
jgi:hypothetical protein